MPSLYKADANEWTQSANAAGMASLAYTVAEHHLEQAKIAAPGSRKREFHMAAAHSHANLALQSNMGSERRVVSRRSRTPVTFRAQKQRRNLS